MQLRHMLCATAILLATSITRADTFTFQFNGPTDAGSGTLLASASGVAGEYLVTGIAGSTNGMMITKLLAMGTYPPDAPNDNTLFFPADPTTPYFDDCGISFELLDGTDVNLYYGTYSSAAGQLGPGYILVQGLDETPSLLTSLSISYASTMTVTPEPSTLTMMMTGMLILGFLLQKRLTLRPLVGD